MKVSSITPQDIALYLKADEFTVAEMQMYMDTAKAYIRSYTGLDDIEIDTHEDFSIVVYILCRDMHDNRSMYIEKGNLNKVVSSILDMHCTNLLPSSDTVVV